tara:strand:+ start:6890 stop:7393 length:504 start_codon:yes stop_codon:yes gene_type:complete
MSSYGAQEGVLESNTAFLIDNVDDEVSQSGGTRERRKVPPGQYDVQVQLVRPNVYTDKKGFKQQMLPLEISDGEYQGDWISLYLWLNNQDSADGKTRDGVSRSKVAMIAKALGITKMTDFHDIAGKFVSVKYGPNARGYNEILEVTPLGAMSAEPADTPKSGDDIPF